MIIDLNSPPHLEYIARTDVRATHGQIYQTINWQWHLYEHRETVIIGAQEYSILPGDITLIRPGLRSEYLGYRGGHRYRVLHFRIDETEKSEQSEDTSSVQRHEQSTRVDLPIHFRISQESSHELSQLHKLMVQSKTLRSQQNRSCLWHLLWRLQALSLDTPEPRGEGVRELEKIISGIESSKYMPLRISDLIAKSTFSQSHLNRLCRERYGLSLKAYLQKSRMGQAKSSLLYTNDSVSSIALAVGIPDLQHFNKTFHSHFGCSPRRWRADNQRL